MNKSDTITIIRSLLSSTNSSYGVYNLNSDFKKETGIDIPLFGYSNTSDFLHSIPDTVKVTGTYPIQRVTLVDNEKSAHIVSLVKRQKSDTSKKRIFPRNKSSSRKANRDCSFRTREIENSESVQEKGIFDDLYKQYDGFQDKNSSCVNQILPAISALTLSSNHSNGLLSLENFLGTEGNIPPIDIKLHARVGEYVEVYPSQIFSPHKFYFHFRKCKKQFRDFMNKLQEFYSSYEEIPQIMDEKIKPKQICAVFHKTYIEPVWHRAEINEIIDNSKVVVNLIDCGDTAEISKKNLKFLHRDFASLPRQAVLGFLANIKPLKGGSEWSRCSIKRFYQLVYQKDLVAGVVYMDPETSCMGLALSCTKGSEIHINDALVQEGYAEFGIDVLGRQFLKRSNLRKTSGEAFNLSNGTNYEQGFSKKNLQSMQNNVSPKVETPIFYFPSNCTNNVRLKKLFSFFEEK